MVAMAIHYRLLFFRSDELQVMFNVTHGFAGEGTKTDELIPAIFCMKAQFK